MAFLLGAQEFISIYSVPAVGLVASGGTSGKKWCRKTNGTGEQMLELLKVI